MGAVLLILSTPSVMASFDRYYDVREIPSFESLRNSEVSILPGLRDSLNLPEECRIGNSLYGHRALTTGFASPSREGTIYTESMWADDQAFRVIDEESICCFNPSNGAYDPDCKDGSREVVGLTTL